ncbi:alpha/beta fold hydrolase [Krasilnikoviella flava]|uniref:Pimeloyl-ACP methyl ester carboxylesterase n=1 Tax=Krasilnikoviella flava TaxID=526729 RepID=A0A1T5IF86_9MICO|nr:alpha/beta fold hydrolase [Krasilnikoviella flava]SKC37683.1 Pimeloyl-ACP methyl ester carboxylesterase [Krasilnikoviella flava]
MPSTGRFTSEAARTAYEAAYRDLEERWPLPSTDVRVETTYGPTQVRRSGDGPRTPLVLLHGLNGTGLSWHGVVPALAAGRVVYAPDVVGTAGRSEQTAPLTTPEAYGSWGAELLEGLGLERAHVLGYSEGAWFAALLGGASDRVAGLVLGEGISALVKPSRKVLTRMVRAAAFPTARNLARLDDWLMPGVPASEEDRALALAAMRYRRRTPWPSPLTDDRLRAIAAPTLAFFGADTRIGDPVAAGRRITEHVRRSRVELVPGGGHGVLWQLPDQVLPLVDGFLQAHDDA